MRRTTTRAPTKYGIPWNLRTVAGQDAGGFGDDFDAILNLDGEGFMVLPNMGRIKMLVTQ